MKQNLILIHIGNFTNDIGKMDDGKRKFEYLAEIAFRIVDERINVTRRVAPSIISHNFDSEDGCLDRLLRAR